MKEIIRNLTKDQYREMVKELLLEVNKRLLEAFREEERRLFLEERAGDKGTDTTVGIW